MGQVPQVPVAYSKATWAALRRARDVFDLPLRNSRCIPQLQETAHVITMDMPLTPQMPECFFPSAVAANVPHDVVHNKFMALMHLQEGTCQFFSADGLHRRLHTSLLLVLFGGRSAQAFTHISPTCPFRRMVCTDVYTCLLLVLFGGWSAQGGKKIALQGGGGDMNAHFPNPPPSLVAVSEP